MAEICLGQPLPQAPPDLDLWLLATEAVTAAELSAFQACLSPPEQAKLATLRRPQAQRQLVISRGWLRHLLSHYTGQPPAALAFVYGPKGKPALRPDIAGEALAPRFNLSHSGQRVLVAISVAAPVRAIGTDIELLRPMADLPGLCRRCLTAAEAATVLPLPPPQADYRFLQYWTGKEACLKALGLGLAGSMQTLELTLGPETLTPAPAAVTVAPTTLPDHPGQLYQWQLDQGYLAAVAVQTVPPASQASLMDVAP